MTSFADRRARFNRAVINRLVTPLSGRVAMWSLVSHVGRRSGKAYTTPVTMFDIDDGVAILLPYGRDRDWVNNLFAAGGGTVTKSGESFAVTNPRIVATSAAAPLVQRPWRGLVGHLGVQWTLLLERG